MDHDAAVSAGPCRVLRAPCHHDWAHLRVDILVCDASIVHAWGAGHASGHKLRKAHVCLLSAFPDTATTGLQTWWLNLVFLVLFTGAVSYSALPPLTAKLAIAVNAVILLSTYLSYLGSVPRSNNTFGSTAVGVISALIGACLPWMDLASQHMAVRTRFASANAFAVAAGKYAGHPGHGLESSCRDCEQPGR